MQSRVRRLHATEKSRWLNYEENRLAKGSKKIDVVSKLPQLSVGNIAVAKVFSISMLVIAIVVIGVLFYQVMANFFVPLFLAALLVVIFRPPHQWILERVQGRRRLASALTTSLILLLVLMPAALIIVIAAGQGKSFVFRLRDGGMADSLDRIRTGLSLDMPASDSFRQLDEDFAVIASPLPAAMTEARIKEATDIVRFIQSEVDSQTPSDDEFSQLIEELNVLGERAQSYAALADGDDSILRERARRAYEAQFAQAYESKNNWTVAILGNSVTARLKMLFNPSASEVQALIEGTQDYLQPRVLPLTQMAGQFLLQSIIGVVILATSLYFFLADGNSMVQTFMRLSPLDDEYERRLLMEFDQISRAVVLASVLSALAQGILAAIAFWFAGLPLIVLLFIATTFMALVPFLGAASVWVPCVIYLAAVEHRLGAAIGLAIFGVTIISTVDNVIKVFVLQGRSQLHPLLALLSVLGGIQVFGPVGILVGPMVVVFLQALLEILNHELEGKATADVPTT